MDNSTSLPEPTLLPGQSPPLTVITPTDQGGVVIIATSLALIFALVSVLLRLFIRVEFRHRFFGDDVAALLSMVSSLMFTRLFLKLWLTESQVFMVVQTGLVFAGVSHGFGKTGEDVSDSDLVIWEKVWSLIFAEALGVL